MKKKKFTKTQIVKAIQEHESGRNAVDRIKFDATNTQLIEEYLKVFFLVR